MPEEMTPENLPENGCKTCVFPALRTAARSLAMTPDRALLLWMDTDCCQTHAHPLHKLAQFSITKVYETQSSVVSPHPLLQQDVESD